MRAILLENDILIAEACDVNWSQNEKINYGFNFRPYIPMLELLLSFRCEYQFLKKFFESKGPKKIATCLLICEDLSHKYLYGLQPRHIEYNNFYPKIDFSIDHFLSEENISKDFNIENKWLKHNRNKRIDEILDRQK